MSSLAVQTDTWSELRSAQTEVEAAARAWRAAQVAWWTAPSGKKQERKAALDAALRVALEADRALKALKREADGR